jgi:hypothetical protein
MSIEKIIANIEDKEYSFTIEVMPAEEGTIYRAVPDQDEKPLNTTIPSYLDFDEHGAVQAEEQFTHGKGREIADAIWRGIKEQVINEHASFNRPLE